jgi:RimJ/RimL family protein N-acetyltransferase
VFPFIKKKLRKYAMSETVIKNQSLPNTDERKIILPHLITSTHNIIRPLIHEDFAAMCSAIKASLDSLQTWIPWIDHNPSSVDFYAITTNFYQEAERGDVIHFACYHNEYFMGLVSLHKYDIDEKTAVLSYWCRADLLTPIYFTSAIKCVLHYVFENIGMRVLVIPIVFGNYISEVMAKELRFKLRNVDLSSGKPIKRFTLNNEDFDRLPDVKFAFE